MGCEKDTLGRIFSTQEIMLGKIIRDEMDW
jgi:hypothetical protein